MRLFTKLSLVALLLSLSGCVQQGVVWRVDSWRRTVTIDQQLYQVTPQTELFGPDGKRIALDSLPAYGAGGVGLRDLARAEVDFRARDGSGAPTLERLWVRRY